MRSFHYLPRVLKPTRFPHSANEPPTLLDHIWTNSTDLNHSGIISIDITDHCPIFYTLPTSSPNIVSDKIKVSFRNLNQSNVNKFQNAISSFDWNSVQSDNVSDFVDKFLNAVNNLFCYHFPNQSKLISKKRLTKPWMTRHIFNLINQKSYFFTSSVKTTCLRKIINLTTDT